MEDGYIRPPGIYKSGIWDHLSTRMNDKCVLLVEDNPDDVALAERAFNKCRITNPVIIAWDGNEALNYLFCRGNHSARDPNQLPAVILLDLKLPKLGGLEVLQQIRIDQRTRALPVVVLTSSFEDKDRAESFRLGANQYLRKPVLFDEFITMVGKLKEAWLDPPA